VYTFDRKPLKELTLHTSIRPNQAAFSLVELSIVLVILGLLTGGILTGQSLIRASELRAVSSEYGRYSTAIGTFRDKYFGIPGDFSMASNFGWGALNGDNDGQIENSATAGANEISTFWIHLASAGLIEGSYTNAAGTTQTSGTHIPPSKLGNAAWRVAGLGSIGDNGVGSPVAGATVPAASTFYDANYGNVLMLGTGTNSLLPAGVLKPEEAWNIDTKMDDGKPDLGAVLTLESQGNATAGAGCGNRATATTALAASDYDLTSTSSSACSLVFKTGY
jgi:prepilin-type N-terminal cleavage/methylation domain-containing protein